MLGLVTYYGPDGAYGVRYVLLEPAVLQNLNYTSKHPSTGKNVRLIFDELPYSYFDD